MVRGDSDFHTKYGMLKKDDLVKAKPGDVLESNTNQKFRVLEPDIIDYLGKARRGPQAVTLKDCATIAAYTGVRSGSRVVDAGVGSGVLSMYLAYLVYPERLVAYEVREDFARIARQNFDKFGIDNVEIKLKSIYDGIDEKELDLVSLDLPEPWLAVEPARKALKVGGYVTSYSPSIEQNKKFVDKLEETESFTHETIELIQRSWNMKTVRPNTRMLGHTGFITIARKTR